MTRRVVDVLRTPFRVAKTHLHIAQAHGVMGELVLPTQKLGDACTGAGREVTREGIHDLLDLRGRVTDHRRVHDDVSRHGVPRIGGRLQRVCGDLRVLDADSPAVPLAIGVRDRQTNCAVSGGENPAVGTGRRPRKRDGDRVDGD